MAQKSESYYRNAVILLSCFFFAIFMPFNTAQSLSTSLAKDLANICLGTLYGVFAFACIFAPKLVTRIGPRVSMCVGSMPYVLMVASFLIKSSVLPIIVHALTGLGAPFLWTGAAVYISRAVTQLEAAGYQTASEAASYLNKIFFSIYHFNGFTGLMIASSVMSLFGESSRKYLFIFLSVAGGLGVVMSMFLPDIKQASKSSSSSSATVALQVEIDDEGFPIAIESSTPVDALDSSHTVNADKDHSDSYGSLAGNHSSDSSQAADPEEEIVQVSFIETITLLFRDARAALLAPMILYNGLSLAFLFADISEGIAAKSLGVKMVGFVMASYYLWNSFLTFVMGKFAGNPKYRGFVLLYPIFAHLLLFILIMTLPIHENFIKNDDGDHERVHSPIPYDYAFAFLAAFLFSLGDCVFQSQSQALLQAYFSNNVRDNNAAMSGLKLNQSLGLSAQFILGQFVDSIRLKALILTCTLVLVFIATVTLLLRYPVETSTPPLESENILASEDTANPSQPLMSDA